MHLDKFNGPDTLRLEWDAFATRYTESGTNDNAMRDINLLNRLLDPSVNVKAFIVRHKKGDFKNNVNEAIHRVCLQQAGDSGASGEGRELNDYLLTRLLTLWIILLTQNDMYPPPDLGKGGSIGQSIKEKRDAIRTGESPGGLLSSAILCLSLGAIRGGAKISRDKLIHVDGADVSQADSEAIIVFDNTLFSFNDAQGDQTLVTGERFKKYLIYRIAGIAARNIKNRVSDEDSLDAPIGDEDGTSRHHLEADEKAVDPAEAAERSDQLNKIKKIIERELKGLELEIIKMLFGLNEEKKIYTPQEISELLDITPEKVRQIKSRSLRIVRSHANDEDDDDEITEEILTTAPEQEVEIEPSTATIIDYPPLPTETRSAVSVATFGECLDGYVTCGGRNISEFLDIYCSGHGFITDSKINILALRHDVNKTLQTDSRMDHEVMERVIYKHGGFNMKQRDALTTRYGLTPRQRKCLDYINGSITNLDTPDTVISRAEETLKVENSPDTYASATMVLKGLIDITPDLTPERLSRTIGGRPGPVFFQRGIKGKKLNPDTLLICIDQIAPLLTENKSQAREAGNLILGLPSSKDMSFSQAIAFARKEGYTLLEFMDMRRYTLRDQVRVHWEKTHKQKKYNPFEAIRSFLQQGKPSGMHLNTRSIDRLRDTSNLTELPEGPVLDFIATRLGAITPADHIAFRQLAYAHALDAGQSKVDKDMEALEAAGTDIPLRKAAYKTLFRDMQERDGLRWLDELAKAIVAQAPAQNAEKEVITWKSLCKTLRDLPAKDKAKTTSKPRAQMIAVYAFKEDPGRRGRFEKILQGLNLSPDTPDNINDKINTTFNELKGSTDSKVAREKFVALTGLVIQREELKSRQKLSEAILAHAVDTEIIPSDGQVTRRSIEATLLNMYTINSTIRSPVRARAIAAFYFKDNEQNRGQFEVLLINGVGTVGNFESKATARDNTWAKK